MKWRRDLEDAPEGDPVVLVLGDDIATAFRRGDEWVVFDPKNPSEVRFVQPAEVSAWRPIPNPEEIAHEAQEAEARAAAAEHEAEAARETIVAKSRERETIQQELQQVEVRLAEQARLRAAEEAERARVAALEEAQRRQEEVTAHLAEERRLQDEAAEAQRLHAIASALGAT